jgi:hypothetical protein
MSENSPIVLIEGIVVFGGALAFAWWQLRDIKRDQRRVAEKKAEADVEASGSGGTGPTEL